MKGGNEYYSNVLGELKGKLSYLAVYNLSHFESDRLIFLVRDGLYTHFCVVSAFWVLVSSIFEPCDWSTRLSLVIRLVLILRPVIGRRG